MSSASSLWRDGRQPFRRAGLAGSDAYLYLIDGRARIVSAWLIAACYPGCGFHAASRRGVMAAVRAHPSDRGLVIDWLLPLRYASYAGGFGWLSPVLMSSLALGRSSCPIAGNGLRVRWSAGRRGAARDGALGLLLAAAAFGQPPVSPERCSPSIPALFPYEGNSIERARKKGFSDSRILTDCRAWRKRTPCPASRLRAISAVHRIGRKIGRDVVVETELVLVASG